MNRTNSDSSILTSGMEIFSKYTIIKKIGEGSFGEVYSAYYGKQKYAIKVETDDVNDYNSSLINEALILSKLQGQGLRVPKIENYSSENNENILIMELMGKSLEEILLQMPEKKFSIPCVCKLGYQMIDIIDSIHSLNIVHSDIKPSNFVMGLGRKSKYLYLIDFGLSRKFRSSISYKHYERKENPSEFIGTCLFASVHDLKGITHSRRDDMESIWYTLLYLLKGSLPWQKVNGRNIREKYKKILLMKEQMSPKEMFEGFPKQFSECMKNILDLKYEEEPDYYYFKSKLREVLNDYGEIVDYIYDWTTEATSFDKKSNSCSDSFSNSTKSNEENNIYKNSKNEETSKKIELSRNNETVQKIENESKEVVKVDENKDLNTFSNKESHKSESLSENSLDETHFGNKELRKKTKKPNENKNIDNDCCIIL